jgi:hypothetical protein
LQKIIFLPFVLLRALCGKNFFSQNRRVKKCLSSPDASGEGPVEHSGLSEGWVVNTEHFPTPNFMPSLSGDCFVSKKQKLAMTTVFYFSLFFIKLSTLSTF